MQDDEGSINASRKREENVETTDGSVESLSEFAGNTSLHGVRFLSQQSTVQKLFWLCCILAAASYCVVQLTESVQFFLKRPYATVITTKQKQVIEFPAVTICNLNLVNTRKYSEQIKKRFPNVTDVEIQSDLFYLSAFFSAFAEAQANPASITSPRNFTAQELASAVRFGSLLNDLKKISYEIEDILLPSQMRPCVLSKYSCNKKNFIPYYISKYGTCFTFKPPVERVSVIGWAAGLRMRLNVEVDSYLRNSFEPFVGLKILVHSPDEYPLVEDKGFVVAPGTHTSCSVRRKEIQSLPYPYETNCGEQTVDLLKDTKYKYSRSACVKQCLLKAIIQTCNCTVNTQLAQNSYPLCVQQSNAVCISSLLAKLGTLSKYLACQNSCQEACRYSEYEYHLSTSRLSEKTLVFDANVFCQKDTQNSSLCKAIGAMTEVQKLQYFRDNVLSIDIFLEDFNFQEIKQVPVYELFALISGIGGNLGLFLGMSLLTTAEFLDYIARSFWFKLRPPCRKRRVVEQQPSSENKPVASGDVFQPEIFCIHTRT